MTIKELHNEIVEMKQLLLSLLQNGSFNAVQPTQTVCPYTLHAWLDEWLKAYKAPSVKANTLYTLDVAIRCHIKKGLPDISLNLITGLELQKFLIGQKQSRTRKTIFDVLKGSFRDAQGLKLIADNPMTAVKIPAHNREKGKHLNVAELTAFKTAIKGHTLEKLYLFLLYSGCRRNEALTLNQADIDEKNKLLHIRGTKTKNANRTIPLFDNLSALLVKITPTKDGFYFPFLPSYVTHRFKKFCPNHKLHDLRHTFATNCLEAKIPLKVVQKWLGHAEMATTADIYSHVTTELNLAEAERFNEYQSKKDT